MNPAFALAEVIWIVTGRRDAAFLNFWNPLLPRFAGSCEHYAGAYGFRLRRQFEVDQLMRARDALRGNPTTRQVVLTIWDPSQDLPDEHGQPRSEDVPCNIVSLLKVREGQLFWTQIMRSNDLVRGLPHNLIQFTYLQEILAGALGLALGSYYHLSDSLHFYTNDAGSLHFDESLELPTARTERWSLDLEETYTVLGSFGEMLDMLRSENCTPERFRSIIKDSHGYQPALDMFSIIAADAARRHGWTHLADLASSNCSDPALLHAWTRWNARCHGSAQRSFIPKVETHS